jgi:hypothetical protein
MTRMTKLRDKRTIERRKRDRRKADLPFSGADRRADHRRSGDDRRRR